MLRMNCPLNSTQICLMKSGQKNPRSEIHRSSKIFLSVLTISDILSMENTTALSIFLKYPMLKKCLFVSNCFIVEFNNLCVHGFTQAKVEFQLIMQRPEIKEEFDEEFILSSKAVVNYCKKKCTKTTAIQKLVKDIDLESEFTDSFEQVQYSFHIFIAHLIQYHDVCQYS